MMLYLIMVEWDFVRVGMIGVIGDLRVLRALRILRFLRFLRPSDDLNKG